MADQQTVTVVLVTPDEAISLLWDNGSDVHNIGPSGMGACWSRDYAIRAIKAAKAITICNWPHHQLHVEEDHGRRSLFETDDEKVEAFLKERTNG